MLKTRFTGNRISLSSWSVPFGRSSDRARHQTIQQSLNFGAATIALPKRASSISSTSRPSSTMASTSKLIELAATITRETEKLDRYMKENGLPTPSFEVDAPSNFPKLDGEIKKAREEVVRATKELGDLVTGPTESVRWMAWDVSFAF